MVTAHRKAKDTEENKLLSELSDFNRKARTSEDPKKVQEFHKACATLVKRIEKEGGVVGNAFGELDYLGKGKPNDEICKLTGRYSRKVLKEESSDDMRDLINVEKVEKKIIMKVEEKREKDKWEIEQMRKAEKLIKDGVKTKAVVVKVIGEPFGPFGKFTDISAIYHVILKRSASSKEEKTGWMGIEFGKLEELEGRDFQGLYEEFRKRGLQDSDTVAEIFAFAPLGAFSLESLSRKAQKVAGKGIGTAALGLMFEDLKSREVAGVWVNTFEIPAIKLLVERLGFEDADLYFFKKL
jgi:hypothetical protein